VCRSYWFKEGERWGSLSKCRHITRGGLSVYWIGINTVQGKSCDYQSCWQLTCHRMHASAKKIEITILLLQILQSHGSCTADPARSGCSCVLNHRTLLDSARAVLSHQCWRRPNQKRKISEGHQIMWASCDAIVGAAQVRFYVYPLYAIRLPLLLPGEFQPI
jgi:hypothetical protein